MADACADVAAATAVLCREVRLTKGVLDSLLASIEESNRIAARQLRVMIITLSSLALIAAVAAGIVEARGIHRAMTGQGRWGSDRR